MKFLLSILASVALLGIVYSGDTVVHKERTKTRTEVRSAGCAGRAVACTGRSSTVTKASSVSCTGTRTSTYTRTRTR